jgi:hypothetical protein
MGEVGEQSIVTKSSFEAAYAVPVYASIPSTTAWKTWRRGLYTKVDEEELRLQRRAYMNLLLLMKIISASGAPPILSLSYHARVHLKVRGSK